MTDSKLPFPLVDAPDPLDRAFAPLFDEPFASAWARPSADTPPPAASQALRGRLLERLAASRDAAEPMVTTRPARLEAQTLAPGVQLRQLYAADTTRQPRPGEPLRACLLKLAPGSALPAMTATGTHREWLVLDGSVTFGSVRLSPRDYHVDPAGCPWPALHSVDGARLFLRESALPAEPGDGPFTVFDEEAGWPEYAPGIRRRVLWQRNGQAALLYCAKPGASVPRHTHGHDEECLMVQGDLFLDDVLLRPGDYQLAPAGSGHQSTETDTGVVIYAHGDLDLRFVA